MEWGTVGLSTEPLTSVLHRWSSQLPISVHVCSFPPNKIFFSGETPFCHRLHDRSPYGSPPTAFGPATQGPGPVPLVRPCLVLQQTSPALRLVVPIDPTPGGGSKAAGRGRDSHFWVVALCLPSKRTAIVGLDPLPVHSSLWAPPAVLESWCIPPHVAVNLFLHLEVLTAHLHFCLLSRACNRCRKKSL